MVYVDGFVLVVPKRSIKAYRKMASGAGKVWREHGALEFKECIADQLAVPGMDGKKISPFPKMVKLRPGETIFFSYIVYKSRAHRDRVNAKVMKDPRMGEGMDVNNMPFDMKRMAYGGFKVLVDK
jgi:uncharacterized protein YbaA (DUF1428 family)